MTTHELERMHGRALSAVLAATSMDQLDRVQRVVAARMAEQEAAAGDRPEP